MLHTYIHENLLYYTVLHYTIQKTIFKSISQLAASGSCGHIAVGASPSVARQRSAPFCTSLVRICKEMKDTVHVPCVPYKQYIILRGFEINFILTRKHSFRETIPNEKHTKL